MHVFFTKKLFLLLKLIYEIKDENTGGEHELGS